MVGYLGAYGLLSGKRVNDLCNIFIDGSIPIRTPETKSERNLHTEGTISTRTLSFICDTEKQEIITEDVPKMTYIGNNKCNKESR